MNAVPIRIGRLDLKNGDAVRAHFTRKLCDERMTITPEMATAILENCQGSNRSVSDATVAKYSADMKFGKWRITHQGIAFSKSGQLLDGQHRMWAIVQSGVAVEMKVTFGLDSEAMLSIDQNRPRSVADAFAIKGMSSASRFVACVRAIAIITGEDTPRSFDRVQKMGEFYKSGIDFALAAGLPGAASVQGAFAFAHKTDPAAVTRFAEQFRTGLNIDSEDDPAATLREFILVNRGAAAASGGRRVATAKRDTSLKVLRCIGAALHGEPLPRIQMNTEIARFFGRAWKLEAIDGQKCDQRLSLDQAWKKPKNIKVKN